MKRVILVYLALCVFVPDVWAGLVLGAKPNYPSWDEVPLVIEGDGLTKSPVACWLLVERCGAISGGTLRYQGSLSDYWDLEEAATRLGMSETDLLSAFQPYGYEPIDLAFITLADGSIPPKPLIGVLVQDIIFEIGGCYEADLALIDADLDSQIVYWQFTSHIPEPATALLFVAGMGFVLRKARFGCGFGKG